VASSGDLCKSILDLFLSFRAFRGLDGPQSLESIAEFPSLRPPVVVEI